MPNSLVSLVRSNRLTGGIQDGENLAYRIDTLIRFKPDFSLKVGSLSSGLFFHRGVLVEKLL